LTSAANSRLAGWMFLIYIAAGIASLVLFNLAIAGANNDAEKVALLAQSRTLVPLSILLALVNFVNAVVLGVTLYGLTRYTDRELALLGMSFRLAEGFVGLVGTALTVSIVRLAAVADAGPDAAASLAAAARMLPLGDVSTTLAAICFAFGSTVFAALFLGARSIPVTLAWLGVVASVLLVVVLPLRLVNYVRGPVTYYVWLPMLIFEVWLALYLIVKGVQVPERAR
jgi:hypothetical protein